MEIRPSQHNSSEQQFTHNSIAQQQTMPYPLFTGSPPAGVFPPMPPNGIPPSTRKRKMTRLIAVLLASMLALALFFIWHGSPSPSAAPAITQQNPGVSSAASPSANPSDTIRVYVVGAVKHPGVYMLANDARVYALLRAAGGVQPQANLVALNLAARLTDGQEVYVTMVGEPVPGCVGAVSGSNSNTGGASTGSLVNINTASADELRQQLHLSSTTAAAIVNYRLQHGSYTAVDQLSQVVSKSIYEKIKGMVTVQ